MPVDTDIHASPPSGVLEIAWRRHYEDHEGALAAAAHCEEVARQTRNAPLRGRALTLRGAVVLQRGDVPGAYALVAAAQREAERTNDDRLHTELAAIQAHLNFFAGAYAESLLQAERAIELADRIGDLELRIFARRSSCLVFGNLGVSDLASRLAELLQLTVAAGNHWEEAMSRNDIAHYLNDQGDPARAREEMGRAFALAETLAPHNHFLLAVLGCTRAEMRLRTGHRDEALADTERALSRLTSSSDVNAYLHAMIVFVKVQALLALERLDEAEHAARTTVERLGERVPHARSLLLRTLADALREAGRAEEAFDALAAGTELERRAYAELSDLQRGLEQATLRARAARRQSETLAARNRQLEGAVRELGEQADRDWLTGLHNRRFLARELHRHAAEPEAGPFSLAVLDLDHFKAINDRFGHDAGDQVLTRIAALLLDEMREQDAVVRTGGEEFVLLMPHTGARAAMACCERLRAAIRREPWGEIAPDLTLTASVGLATAADASDLESLSTAADERLYSAKHAGRDRVVAVSDDSRD